MSLKRKWFEMTKSGIKTEDYREITPHWIKRLYDEKFLFLSETINPESLFEYSFKKFDTNTMTLGYPKSGDTERILVLEHVGIEIRTGNPEWGAEPGKLYFVIKHGEKII
jgi:hypothetical protein